MDDQSGAALIILGLGQSCSLVNDTRGRRTSIRGEEIKQYEVKEIDAIVYKSRSLVLPNEHNVVKDDIMAWGVSGGKQVFAFHFFPIAKLPSVLAVIDHPPL